MFDAEPRTPEPHVTTESLAARLAPAVSPPPATRRVMAVAEVLLCSSVPTQLTIGAFLSAIGIPPQVNGRLSFDFVVILSLVDAAVLIPLMIVIARSHGESIGELWWGRRRVWREILLGLLLAPVVLLMVALLLGLLRTYAPWLHNVETNPLEQLAAASTRNAILFGLVAILAGGVREELQRAFLLSRFEKHLGGTIVGVLVLSAAFGAGHYEQGWDASVATGALGAFWAIVYVLRRSVIAPMVSHSAFNSLEILRVSVDGIG